MGNRASARPPASGARYREQLRDLLMVAAWALALRLLFAALTADTYDPDEFVLLALGRTFAHGAVPYRDFMFFHPPGVLVFFRVLQPLITWWWPVGRVLMILIDTLTAVCVWRIGLLLHGRREALAAGLLYGASPLALVCSVRVGQDPIITSLGVLGLLLLLSSHARRFAALAGVCLGVAVWTKYPALLFLPVYVIAAPRRWHITAGACVLTLTALFAPFAPQTAPLIIQTVAWQVSHRTPLDPIHRIGAVGAFWLLLNPLAVVALRWTRRPAWLLVGFCLGGVFVLASQAYYHYFEPIVPFAALLGAPVAIRLCRQLPAALPAVALTLSVAWAADIAFGSAPTRLFISALRLSAIRSTVQFLDRSTRPGDGVLTDQMEYTFLARRQPVAGYFWNVGSVVNARYLERRMRRAKAVVVTEHVSPTYPKGFTRYLDRGDFAHRHLGGTEVWLVEVDPDEDRPRVVGARVGGSSRWGESAAPLCAAVCRHAA